MQDLFKTKKFQLETESSWKHLWSKPVFDYLHSDHFDGERFKNLEHHSLEQSRFDLYKWLFTRKRSEEHTSELQSRPHLVCRLLLEKKKTSREIVCRLLNVIR